jgi:hypothetical protein
MMNRRSALLAILAVAFVGVAVVQIFRLAEENRKYEKLLSNSQRVDSGKKQYLNSLEKIKVILDDDRATPTEIIRRTMEFVHNNSVHLIDEEHRKYAFDIPVVINKLILAYEGDGSEKPHLSCGPRSYAMREILTRFGIFSRLVQVFSDDYQELKGHRLLEVFNPETGSWEAWDPDYRVTYVDPESKKRLDIMEVIFGDKEKLVPQDGAIMGWEETKTVLLREHYFEAALFEGTNNGMNNSIIIINPHEFNLGKTFSDGLTLREWMLKHYLHPRFIILPY